MNRTARLAAMSGLAITVVAVAPGTGGGGTLQPLGTTATDAGTVDATSSADGQYLYAETGANGIVDEFRVGSGGSLTPIGSVTVPGAVGAEGIAAS